MLVIASFDPRQTATLGCAVASRPMIVTDMLYLLATAEHLRALASAAENPLQAAELLELAGDFDLEFDRSRFGRSAMAGCRPNNGVNTGTVLDAAQLKERAARFRRLADETSDDVARQALIQIVSSYEAKAAKLGKGERHSEQRR
jgi:hypothetical protein